MLETSIENNISLAELSFWKELLLSPLGNFITHSAHWNIYKCWLQKVIDKRHGKSWRSTKKIKRFKSWRYQNWNNFSIVNEGVNFILIHLHWLTATNLGSIHTSILRTFFLDELIISGSMSLKAIRKANHCFSLMQLFQKRKKNLVLWWIDLICTDMCSIYSMCVFLVRVSESGFQ